MNYSDIVQCYRCKERKMRGQTLILQTPKGRFRICRDCYAIHATDQLNEEYKETKKNILLFGIQDTDSYEITKKKEKFIKDIKEGKWQNIT